MNWHTQSISQVEQLLKTQASGLSQEEVLKRQQVFGKNVLVNKQKQSAFVLFVLQFKDVMIFILLMAAVISFAVGDNKDGLVILLIVLLNAIIGFVQEYRAEKAMEALQKISAPESTVRRNGRIERIPSSELVAGDIVLLETGDVVPADIRLSSVIALRMEEASLTGESNPIDKRVEILQEEDATIGDRFNMAFKSTVVANGRGEGIVVAIGMNTEMGRIAKLLQNDRVKTPLQNRLADFGRKLSVLVILICVVLYLVGLLRGEDPFIMLLTAISVAVAAIPESLPAVVTIALALGARRMVKKNALIRKLPAVETLGSVNYICSDKTGTITQNRMVVTDTWIPSGPAFIPDLSQEKSLLYCMLLNQNVLMSENNGLTGDPTEVALYQHAIDHLQAADLTSDSNIRVAEIPFDSNRKRMTTIHSFGGQYVAITKGASESVNAVCVGENLDKASQAALEFARSGKRVLAYAIKLLSSVPDHLDQTDIEKEMQLVGLAAMMDPPREEAKQAISECHDAGITPVMITGDHPETARTIARETGIIRSDSDLVITGLELAAMSEAEYTKELEYIKVYARVSPEQKLQIVMALQEKGHFVAMTGDGVNDAPALKRANIGVAMGITGTDVSKEAAHLILLDDNFATIMKAVREGRRIYDNIRKFVKYVMTCNSGELWTIFLAPLLGMPIPLLPIHILWINLVTDGLPGLAMAAEPAESNILKRKPRKPSESIFAGGIGYHIAWVGLLMAVVSISVEAWALNAGNSKWQTMVFTVLSLSQMGHALAIRSDRRALFQKGFFSNIQLLVAVFITLLLQLMVIYLPFFQDIFRTQALTMYELAICLGLSSIVMWAVEIEKWVKRTFGEPEPI